MKQESTESKRVWHSGPPPHVGWWSASISKSPDYWRWWNGISWSGAAMPFDNPYEASLCARSKSGWENRRIFWNDYYPANARVPRINPDK